jgi:Family of unknown function (DUF6533)
LILVAFSRTQYISLPLETLCPSTKNPSIPVHLAYRTLIGSSTCHLKQNKPQFKQHQTGEWQLARAHRHLSRLYDTSTAENHVAIAAFGEYRAHGPNPANSLRFDTALLVYDSLLSLSQEIHYIWNSKLRLGTVLYVLARYTVLLFLLIEFIANSLDFPLLQVCLCENSIDSHE